MLTSDRQAPRVDQDLGAVLVLMALLITVMLFVVAIVIDFGNVRNTRQDTKRIADLATAAGLADLAPDGKPRPWAGACTALDYLQANRPGLAVTYWDGGGPAGGNSRTDPCLVRDPDPDDGDVCVPGDLTTQAWIRAEADGLTVDIRAGYETGPTSGFSEDVTAYAGDDGEALLRGCDQLAVITVSNDSELFGGIAGSTGYETANRSVGRVVLGSGPGVAVALVLLEEHDCASLSWAGTGALTVSGTGDRPGIIHANSDGTGHRCNNRVVLEGKQQAGHPLVRALAAPDDASIHGIISTYARFLGRSNDAKWNPDRSQTGSNPTEVWACDPDSGAVGPSPCSTGPQGSDRVTREHADDRYRAAVTSLRQVAKARFAEMASGVPPGYTSYTSLGYECTPPSGPPIEVTGAEAGTRLYVDCPVLDVRQGSVLVIGAGIEDVAFEGRITFQGNGLLDIRDPRRVYVNNVTGGASAIAATGQAELRINANGASSCEARWTAAPSATTELVVRTGGLSGGAQGTMQLCSTFVHLMGGLTGDDPLGSTATYPSPYEGAAAGNGVVSIGAGNELQWTAPNTVSGPPTEGDYDFEDLALWTETSSDTEIGGGGSMVLKGVYFLPNTGVGGATGGLSLSGGGSGQIDLDAQLWARKLRFTGGAEFRMRANPADSVVVPFLASQGLVR